MPSTLEFQPEALERARAIKRLNTLAAIFAGILPAFILLLRIPTSIGRVLLGVLIGVIWANAFEYVYHRYILHRPHSSFARRHGEHHRASGTNDEADHVNFGGSPWWIVLLIVTNGLPVVLLDIRYRLGVTAGILIAFSLYFVLVEEIHWRIHLGGWLPPGIEGARVYHMTHHNRPAGRYNVFFPLFDWICGTASEPGWMSRAPQAH